MILWVSESLTFSTTPVLMALITISTSVGGIVVPPIVGHFLDRYSPMWMVYVDRLSYGFYSLHRLHVDENALETTTTTMTVYTIILYYQKDSTAPEQNNYKLCTNYENIF